MTVKHVAIFSGKGGVGKTTLAVALSQYSNRVLLDADPQCSAADWADLRQSDSPQVVVAPLARLPRMMDGQEASIIDMPGNISNGAVAALQVADLTLVITGDRLFELNAIQQSLEIARMAGGRAAVVLNRLHPFTDPTPVVDAIAGLGAEVCPVVIRERSAHYKALLEGKTATEYDPDGAAAMEIAKLWQWIEGLG